ncbi:hypothetical protein [Aureimonas psammosilenae]|uniref:hypothetical protein n=1 Tax=Aureimonas psammosilenae TaxID=2495496 RepID=UPI001260ACD1|nr:hypothetical protein [Aureimonas psammosilenae]
MEIVADLMASGQSPAEYLVTLYRNEQADPKDRAWAANAVAPYVHPRLAPTAQKVTLDLPDTSTAEGVRDAIARVVQSVAVGEIAPSEGQSMVAVIEAQRKAIETVDVLKRLETLEASYTQSRPA